VGEGGGGAGAALKLRVQSEELRVKASFKRIDLAFFWSTQAMLALRAQAWLAYSKGEIDKVSAMRSMLGNGSLANNVDNSKLKTHNS
jgi:hypothetical protein